MAERKKVTLDSLIKRKLELKGERKVEGTLYIPSLEGDVEIEVLKSDVVDFLEVTNGKSTEEEIEKAGHNLIYTIVKTPNLGDKELQKAFECVEPTEIVKYIFTDGEMLDIVDYAISSVGMRRGVVEEVKN